MHNVKFKIETMIWIDSIRNVNLKLYFKSFLPWYSYYDLFDSDVPTVLVSYLGVVLLFFTIPH
jgi:hypothetical protein